MSETIAVQNNQLSGDPFKPVGISQQNLVTYHNYLTGQLLTIVDACFSDIEQRKAIKSLIKKDVWGSFEILSNWILSQDDKSQSTFPFSDR